MTDAELLLRLADVADSLTLPGWRSGVTDVETKPDGSPVTATDVEVETRLRAILAGDCSEDAFVAGKVRSSLALFWTCPTVEQRTFRSRTIFHRLEDTRG